MSLSTVLFLFLAHLGVGIAFTLAFVSREAGVKFFRFNAGLAAILIAIALAFRYGALGPAVSSPSREDQIADLALACGEAALVLYWATVGRSLARIRPAIAAVAISAELVAIVLQALDVSSGQSLAVQTLTVASLVGFVSLGGIAVRNGILRLMVQRLGADAAVAGRDLSQDRASYAHCAESRSGRLSTAFARGAGAEFSRIHS